MAARACGQLARRNVVEGRLRGAAELAGLCMHAMVAVFMQSTGGRAPAPPPPQADMETGSKARMLGKVCLKWKASNFETSRKKQISTKGSEIHRKGSEK
jgi:hypothetical protein